MKRYEIYESSDDINLTIYNIDPERISEATYKPLYSIYSLSRCGLSTRNCQSQITAHIIATSLSDNIEKEIKRYNSKHSNKLDIEDMKLKMSLFILGE